MFSKTLHGVLTLQIVFTQYFGASPPFSYSLSAALCTTCKANVAKASACNCNIWSCSLCYRYFEHIFYQSTADSYSSLPVVFFKLKILQQLSPF